MEVRLGAVTGVLDGAPRVEVAGRRGVPRQTVTVANALQIEGVGRPGPVVALSAFEPRSDPPESRP